MKAIHWLVVGMLATVALAVMACAAPPAWVAPTPPPHTNTLAWTPSVCLPGTTCKPFTYVLFTNDVLVTASIPETATNYSIVATPGVVEYALAASNTAGRSACAVVVATNPAPPVVAAQPSTLRLQ